MSLDSMSSPRDTEPNRMMASGWTVSQRASSSPDSSRRTSMSAFRSVRKSLLSRCAMNAG